MFSIEKGKSDMMYIFRQDQSSSLQRKESTAANLRKTSEEQNIRIFLEHSFIASCWWISDPVAAQPLFHELEE